MSDVNRIAQAFQPGNGINPATTALVPTAAAQTLPLIAPLQTGGNADPWTQFEVVNGSTVPISITFANGSAAPVAATLPGATANTAGGYTVLSLARRTVSIPGNPTSCSIIGSGTPTGSVYVTPGYGSN